MKYDFNTIMALVNKIEGYDFWKDVKVAEGHLLIQEEVLVCDLDSIKLVMSKNEKFKDSNIAPINPAMNREVYNVTATWHDLPVGRFSLEPLDFEEQSTAVVNETIVTALVSSIKSGYFWHWYRANIVPFMAQEVPFHTAVDLIKERLGEFGIALTFSYDGTVLHIQAYTEEPYKVLWAIQQVSGIAPPNIHEHGKGFFGTMTHDVFYHLFYNVTNGMGTSYDPEE